MRRTLYWTYSLAIWLFTASSYSMLIERVPHKIRVPALAAAALASYAIARALIISGKQDLEKKSSQPRKEAPMASFHVFEGEGDQPFRFRFDSGDGHTLSSEGYASKDGRDNGVRSVRENAVIDDRYDKRVSDDLRSYFVLKAGNGEIIGKSKMYDTNAERNGGIERIKATVTDATVVEDEKGA